MTSCKLYYKLNGCTAACCIKALLAGCATLRVCNEAVIEAIVETAIERGVCKLQKQPGSSITNAEYDF